MARAIEDLIVPRPRKVLVSAGRVELGELATVRVCGTSREGGLEYALEALSAMVGKPVRRTDAETAEVLLVLGEEGVAGKGGESYRVSLSPGYLEIAGKTPRALYYGIQTLAQVVEVVGRSTVPPAEIEDWPRFGFRCYSDDISRRQVSTLRDFEFIIRNLSRLKYNHYQPYIEDVIMVDAQPMLGLGRGRLSRDDIGSMVACGRRHFVEIMPQCNALSHAEHMLARPEYASWRFNGNLETMDPQRSEVRAFLKDVFAQMFTQFPCEYFHMGLDEARGLTQRPDLYVSHANWLAEIVLNAGRKPIMWHDMFVPYDANAIKYSPKLLDKLNRDIILDQWLYENDPPRAAFVREMTGRGFRVMLSPALSASPCGDGTRRQWDATSSLLRVAEGDARVLGVNNTSWNDNGMGDRHIHWRGHAISAETMWNGPTAVDGTARVGRAFACQYLGIHNSTRADQLTSAAEFGQQFAVLDKFAIALPRALAQGVVSEDMKRARAFMKKERAIRASLASVRRAATRNADYLDHAGFGLERLRAGAQRILAAPKLKQAMRSGKVSAVERLAAADIRLLTDLRSGFADVWLRRHRPEGLEHADLRFCAAISSLRDLAWERTHDHQRHECLKTRGMTPLDLGSAANFYQREYASLAWGEIALDNVAWRVMVPKAGEARQFVATRSSHLPEQAEIALVRARSVRATRLHALHACFGNDRSGGTAGVYRVVHADGSSQEILVRAGRDGADWWMPFGHPFGGGGVHRLDTTTCRLAFLNHADVLATHGLYHFWVSLENVDSPVERVEIAGGTADCSLIVAALTLENESRGVQA